MEPAFLGSYFLCAALAIPLWLRLVKHIGLARTWLVGMLLSMAVFIFASQPLLGAFGYAPGVRTEGALQALTVAYCLLPCALKFLAATALYWLIIRPARALRMT